MRHHSDARQSRARYYLLVLLLLLPAAGRGDSITTEVTCSPSSQVAVVAAGSCSQTANQSLTRESITTFAGYSSSAPDYFTVQLENSGTAGGNIGSDAQANSSANVSLSLQTAGPVRRGFIEILPSYGADAEYASLSSLLFSIGYLHGSCSAPAASCSLKNPGVNHPDFPRMYDFNLGDPFSVDVNYSSVLGAPSEDYNSHTSVQFSLQFVFFEADGVTPVAISPEPSTWMLALLGIAAGICGRRRFSPHTLSNQ